VSDADLIARARHGDAAAFGELVDRYKTAVYRAALAALGSPADAEDAAQDAFISAFRRLGSFRGDASFKTWLLTIAWNQALNRRRGRSRWQRSQTHHGWEGLDGREGLEESSDNRAPSPEQAAIDRQLRCAIITEIRSLPPKLKDALLLAQSGEYTYEEIGAMLGTPAGTIKWRVSEARKTIKTGLHARGFTDVG
jgi:RNA polymerase sigma-70 factor (ECF subfamily)